MNHVVITGESLRLLQDMFDRAYSNGAMTLRVAIDPLDQNQFKFKFDELGWSRPLGTFVEEDPCANGD